MKPSKYFVDKFFIIKKIRELEIFEFLNFYFVFIYLI